MMAEFWNSDRYDSEARRLYDDGDYEAALRLLQEGLSLHPGSAELRVSLGYAQLAREEYAWARGWFEEALSLEPDHEEGLVGLGETLLKLGERSRALLAFHRVVELGFDSDPDLMLGIGRALVREGLYERGVRFFGRALQADPNGAEAAAELAYALYRGGEVEGAERWCRRALEADPGLQEARVFLGNLLYDRGAFASALEELERIPPETHWDPMAAWRTVELLRRVRGLSHDDPGLEPYIARLEELGTEPTPEDQLIAEVEALWGPDGAATAALDRSQLDLFASPAEVDGEPEAHRVRLPDGRIYEGDWLSIVRAMRDHSADPSLSVSEFMREEARRLQRLTGASIPDDDPRAFLEEAARVGVLRLDL